MTNRFRRDKGASLVLVIAIFGFLALMIMVFCLKFTGFMGSYHEQRSAIEAAALAAAKDLSAIVIVDPNFGLIGLSDSSPIGTATAARDGFDSPVTGINTLFGTIRLDLIISDYLQDPLMRQLALNDYTNALVTQKNLVAALNAATASGGTGTDINGNVINPTQDAINAYNSNKVHLVVAQNSNLVPDSLKLSLGYVDGLATRTPIPQPQSISSVASSQQSQGFYNPDVVINYTNSNTQTPFVFAAQGPNATLVDFRVFQTSINGLPYDTPAVVKVDANEQYTESSGMSRTIRATAAALSGTVVDQRPNPGAFTITFVDGPVPEIVQPGDLINSSQIQADPTDMMQSPLTGDYPQTALSNYAMPFLPDPDSYHPRFENVFSVALYDWVKRGGATVNVQNVINMLQTPMNYGVGGPQQQRFHLTSSGAVTNDSIPWGQTNLCVSNKQYRAISGLGIISSNKNSYDLQITDYVRQPGSTNGGLHVGEPLNVPGTSGMNPNAASYAGSSMYENLTWPYQEFLTGSGVRPTYNKEGIAVDFTIRMRH
jgi:hypothetical protein